MPTTINKICVLGLGYIGLPTASIFATTGFQVLGVDTNLNVVEILKKKQVHIEEPGLKTVVQAAINSGNFRVGTEPEPADAFILAVPTPIDEHKRADLSYVIAATRAIVPHLRPGNVVILESTSPPRTTIDVVAPILAESGLIIGKDLFVAHCPERVLPGRILKELIENPRIIGGMDRQAAEMVRDMYSTFVEGQIHLTDATTAEMAKIMENTYRDVNIALANELALMCARLGINAWEVIELANLHPRVHLHKPGPGVGGHCISVDPWFLVEKLPNEAKLVRQARLINEEMPNFVINMVREQLAGVSDPKVTILGVTYKGNVDDTRESPALPIIEGLLRAKITCGIYDPHVKHFDFELLGLEEAFRESDAVVLLADHNEFKYLHPLELGKLMRHRVIIDTKHVLNLDTWAEAGFKTLLLGNTTGTSHRDEDRLLQSHVA